MNFIVNCNWDFDADTFEGLTEEAKDFVSRLLIKEKRYLSLFPDCWSKRRVLVSYEPFKL